MASSPSRPSHSRAPSRADSATQYSFNLDALTPLKANESSLMDCTQAIDHAIDAVRSEDIEGPSDFTQNMEFWMRGGETGDTKRKASQMQHIVESEVSNVSGFPEEHANHERPAVDIEETVNVEEQHAKLEQRLASDESNISLHEEQVAEKPCSTLPGQDSANSPPNSELQFKIKALEVQLATATSTIATLVNENTRLQLERDDANLRRAEVETLRDSFETRNEQSCERVKQLDLELKHLRNQVERTGVKPARLVTYIDDLKSANERSKAEVKELEEKIGQLEGRVEQFKTIAEQAQKMAQREEIMHLYARREANQSAEKFERLEAERLKALADFERFKSIVQNSHTRSEYPKGRFEEVSEKTEYFEKKENEADAVISQSKEHSKRPVQRAVKLEKNTNMLKGRLRHYKMALRYAKTEYDNLEFEKDEIAEQRDWLSEKCDRYAESLRKQGWARRAAREREKKAKQELEAIKKIFENVNAEMDKKIKELLVQRDHEWITRIEMLDKDRKIMSQVLLQEWGKGELGKSEPQVYRYQSTDIDQ